MKLIANYFRTIFLLITLTVAAVAHEQILLVVADDMNSSQGTLQRFEKSKTVWKRVGTPVPVSLGRNGLAWGAGIGLPAHPPGDPEKREGDGRAPAGIFELGPLFGYAPAFKGAMPYVRADADLICIDDAQSPYYNTLRHINVATTVKSFEWMRRDDGLYRFGAFVHHNDEHVPGRGSCIFLHIWRAPGMPTAGCTAMSQNNLRHILQWLDPAKKPLLIQIPARALPDIEHTYGKLDAR